MFWTARVLLVPAVLIVSAMLASPGPARAGDPAKTKAAVQIGFVGVVPSPQRFQNVLLNVQGVRINPNAGAGPGDKKWQTIPVPPAGTLVPICPSAPGGEGCINYPIQLQNPGNPIVVVATGTTPLVSPKKEMLAPLVLQLKVDIVSAGLTSGSPYMVNVTLAQLSNQLFATVNGTITAKGGTVSNKKKTRKLTVAAETAGTNTVIAKSPIGANSTYTLALPAAGNFGSLYDLTVSGGAVSYGATRLPPIMQGDAIIPGGVGDFTVNAGQTLGNITGKISDACTGTGISGATLQLFIAPQSNPTANCADPTMIGECISVATTSTDNSGAFPLPGTVQTPAAFNSVPILKSTDMPPTYSMMVTAPGYDTLVTPVNASRSTTGGVCGMAPNTAACNLSLNTGFISGAFQITSPLPGQTVLVQVFAEDHGTNKIESALAAPVMVRNPSIAVPFTINVPPMVSSFDLFATTIDLFQGVSDPYQGHTIEVISGVPSPADSYKVQRFQVAQQPTVAPTATPTPVPSGPPVGVTIPLPTTIPTPSGTPTPFIKCPTTCSHPNGTCPGNCNSVQPQL